MSDEIEEYEAECKSYRDKWHATKLSLYSGFMAFDGLVVSVCSIGVTLAPKEERGIFFVVILLSLLSVCLVLGHYHLLARLYDRLGFRPTPKTDEGWTAELQNQQAAGIEFARRRWARRVADFVLFASAMVRILCLAYYVHHLAYGSR
jgi:hypothetical protein